MTDKPTIRCSALDQLLQCPGSRTLIETLGASSESGEAAHEGNWCHYEAARRLIAEHGAIGPEGGLPEPELPEGWAPTPWSHWLVDYYLNIVASWTDYDQALIVEDQLVAEFERFILSGHMDLFAITPDGKKAVAFDLKTGNIAVPPAEENNQVLGYVTLLLMLYPDLDEITFLIVQPRNNPDMGEQRVTHVVVSREDMLATREYLESQINDALDNPMTVNSGPRQCLYCPVKLQCPAIKEDIRMAKVTLTAEHMASLKEHPDPEEFVEIETSRKVLEPVFDENKKMLKWYLESTGEIALDDGRRCVLVERNGTRSITDNEAAAAALQDLPDPIYYRCFKFKPSEIEKALAEALGLPKTSKKGQSAESEYRERLGDITQQPKIKMVKLMEA